MIMTNFDQPVREVLSWLRIEAGLSPATLAAYQRDLDDLVADMASRGITSPSDVTPRHLADHLQFLHVAQRPGQRPDPEQPQRDCRAVPTPGVS